MFGCQPSALIHLSMPQLPHSPHVSPQLTMFGCQPSALIHLSMPQLPLSPHCIPPTHHVWLPAVSTDTFINAPTPPLPSLYPPNSPCLAASRQHWYIYQCPTSPTPLTVSPQLTMFGCQPSALIHLSMPHLHHSPHCIPPTHHVWLPAVSTDTFINAPPPPLPSLYSPNSPCLAASRQHWYIYQCRTSTTPLTVSPQLTMFGCQPSALIYLSMPHIHHSPHCIPPTHHVWLPAVSTDTFINAPPEIFLWFTLPCIDRKPSLG